jgi:arsenate reductase-like glutaredoxin family protein
VGIGNRRAGEDIFKKADENFKRIDKEKLSELKEEGIDYIVQFKEVTMDLPVVIENNKYKVYKIN